MTQHIRTENRPTTAADGTVYVLEDPTGAARLEVWPALGFNAYSWTVRQGGRTLDLLYADPGLFDNGRPTRSGIPILFPFPNRIRAGRFVWEGKSYELPLNDSTQQNAIHGFACRKPWRVIDQGSDRASTWITAEFHGAKDAPESLALWPADYRIRVTYRLNARTLRVEAAVDNPDSHPLPFGLGYHPYFKLPADGQGAANECQVEAGAEFFWELRDSLPTGTRVPVDGARRLQPVRRFADLQLDDVLTDLPGRATLDADGLFPFGSVHAPSGAGLKITASPDFRELVAFTPPHRQAICLEPYTCATDAINLQAHGTDAGWLVLAPGQSWSAVFAMTADL